MNSEFNKMNWPEHVGRNFWSHVNYPGNDQACWEWQAYTLWDGYGQFRFFGKNIKCHKVAYMYYFGPIPPGLWILHNCDNRLCVNPEHLYAGTRKDNDNDVINRGRLQGSKNGNNILIEEDIYEIITDVYNDKYRSCSQIANKYNLDTQTIRNIFKRKSWKHVTKDIEDKYIAILKQKLGLP